MHFVYGVCRGCEMERDVRVWRGACGDVCVERDGEWCVCGVYSVCVGCVCSGVMEREECRVCVGSGDVRDGSVCEGECRVCVDGSVGCVCGWECRVCVDGSVGCVWIGECVGVWSVGYVWRGV